ncbi:MAG: beta-ketoacyl-[acyl-carrier-protein] synthase family protein [Nitrospirota bacterium]
MKGRAVITGIGVLSSIGKGRDAYWKALQRGATGVRPITLFDAAPFRVKSAGEIADFEALAYLGKKGLRDLDRSTRLVCSAAKLALDDSGLAISDEMSRSVGVAIGTTFGSLHSIAQFDRSGLTEGPRFVNPSHFPNTVINSPASQVSIRFTIKGFNTTLSTGFCAGLDALSYAADFIRLGRADAVLAGGVEELCEETYRLFHDLGYLSGMSGAEPVSRPFDAGRDGFVLSEGSAVLVAENEEYARSRGADILAVILGCGNAFDPEADSTFERAGRGLKTAIAQALEEACVRPKDVGYVCSCANGMPGLDRMEARILHEVFGEDARHVPVSSIKSMIGETYSASGALAVAAAVGGLRQGFIPPTVNHRQTDTLCALDIVPNAARAQAVKTVLVTAADPYGQNSALVVGGYNR